jgi:hypothetical protein
MFNFLSLVNKFVQVLVSLGLPALLKCLAQCLIIPLLLLHFDLLNLSQLPVFHQHVISIFPQPGVRGQHLEIRAALTVCVRSLPLWMFPGKVPKHFTFEFDVRENATCAPRQVSFFLSDRVFLADVNVAEVSSLSGIRVSPDFRSHHSS